MAEIELDELARELEPLAPPPSRPPPISTVEGRVQVGDRILVTRLGQTGRVLALDANGADVQIGNLRARLKLSELGGKVVTPEEPTEAVTSRVSVPSVESPGVEVSLRGMRADDALDKLDKYLDRAYLAGLPYVRVVHGKGTGTLRKLARDLLNGHPLVASIRPAEQYEGGEGVTVVKLVSR